VEEAAVIGVPDKRWGESVRAIVVPKKGSNITSSMLQSYCQKHLARYKKPKSIIFVESLPRAISGGRVLKRLLREKYAIP